jgi:CHAD domain-containing protein
MPKRRSDELPALAGAIETLADVGSFTGATSVAVAGRIMLAKHTRKLYEHLPGARAGDDPHAIHQMRVATRRLRASLQATMIAYRPEAVDELRRGLRRLARTLGAVRDLDVMLIRLRDDAAAYGEIDRSELDATIERLETKRKSAHAELVAELRRKRTTRLLRDLNMFLLCPLADVEAGDNGLPLLVRHHAGSAIWREYEAVQRFETAMPHASSEQLHELRIACKHLRYTLELFQPALISYASGLIKLVEKMQEHLGHIHDADVALAYFGTDNSGSGGLDVSASTATDDPEQATAQSSDGLPMQTAPDQELMAQPISYADSRLAERSKLLAQVEPLWQQISSQDTRRKLGKVLAAL